MYVNNYIFEVLKKELGVTHAGQIVGNNVYQPVHISKQQLFQQHEKFLLNFNIFLDDENKHVPNLYWTSKQHNTPYKSRFIAGARKSTSKQFRRNCHLL